MSTYLEPNYYPDDFAILVVAPGNKDTAVFVNDRDHQVVTIDSIRLLPGARATTLGDTVFKVNDAAGETIQSFTVPVAPTTNSVLQIVKKELKPGEALFADVNTATTQAQYQIRLRSRVA